MEVTLERPKSVFQIQHNNVCRFLKKKDADKMLRPPQIQAVQCLQKKLMYDAAKEPEIALVVLPTGCGKTGVAVLAPYVLNATQVLIITPSKTISKQIWYEFCGGPKSFFCKSKILTEAQTSYYKPKAAFITETKQIPFNLNMDLMIITAHQVGGKSRVAIEEIPSNGYDLVIVDEAHHYPAHTWKTLIDHFSKSKRLFLTATPFHRGVPILQHEPCYRLYHSEAVAQGIIRNVQFDEVCTASETEEGVMKDVAKKIMEWLNDHDQMDRSIQHQAMVLAQVVSDEGGPRSVNPAMTFEKCYNEVMHEVYHSDDYAKNQCEYYAREKKPEVVDRFRRGEIRTLVVVGRLLEGFDHNKVSVLGIVRNVGQNSRVLFNQFVGRAVRKVHANDPVSKAILVSHKRFDQRENFNQFDETVPDDNVIVDADDDDDIGNDDAGGNVMTDMHDVKSKD